MSSVGEKYTAWIIEAVKLEEYVKKAIEKGKKIDLLLSEGKIIEAENEFKIVSELSKVAIPSGVYSFFKNVQNVNILKEEKTVEEFVPESVYDGIMENIHLNKNDKIVLKIPQKINYLQISSIAKKIWSAQEKLVFIVSPSCSLTGRIITDMNNYENVELIRGFVKETEDGTVHNINMLGDFGNITKGQKCRSVLTLRMSQYVFLSDNNIHFIVFSEKPLKLGRCELVGTIIPVFDRKKIGEEAKKNTLIDVIIVSDYKPHIMEITKEVVNDLKKSFNSHDAVFENMFGKFRHPEWFEKLIFSILVTNNNYDYPVHFLMIGPAGSGKTRGLLMPLCRCFDEIAGVVSGTSTIKGLIPSFKESPPTVGHLCKSEKVALIDEFFNFLGGGEYGRKVEGRIDFGQLKDVLDHEEKTFISGNGSINTKMQSIMIAVTNIKKYQGLIDVPSTCENLDKPFLSRLLIYNQNDQHIEFVNNNKFIVNDIGQDKALPVFNREFLNLFLWLQNEKVSSINSLKVKEIYKKYEHLIPGVAIEVYKGRYDHHLKCIIAGVCKYHWLIGKKEELIVNDLDYEVADEIFGTIIASWLVDSEDLNKLPLIVRKSRLDLKEKIVYDLIEKEKQPILIAVENLMKYTNLEKSEVQYAIVRLQNIGLIKQVSFEDGSTYVVPHWYSKGDEKK